MGAESRIGPFAAAAEPRGAVLRDPVITIMIWPSRPNCFFDDCKSRSRSRAATPPWEGSSTSGGATTSRSANWSKRSHGGSAARSAPSRTSRGSAPRPARSSACWPGRISRRDTGAGNRATRWNKGSTRRSRGSRTTGIGSGSTPTRRDPCSSLPTLSLSAMRMEDRDVDDHVKDHRHRDEDRRQHGKLAQLPGPARGLPVHQPGDQGQDDAQAREGGEHECRNGHELVDERGVRIDLTDEVVGAFPREPRRALSLE